MQPEFKDRAVMRYGILAQRVVTRDLFVGEHEVRKLYPTPLASSSPITLYKECASGMEKGKGGKVTKWFVQYQREAHV
jgi:hypothetical protein